jgi:23S rRNA-/tRNA-specific pseudouridylate synthase
VVSTRTDPITIVHEDLDFVVVVKAGYFLSVPGEKIRDGFYP